MEVQEKLSYLCNGPQQCAGDGAEAVTCNVWGMFVFLCKGNNNYTCSKCKLAPHLSTLHFIMESEVLIDRTQEALLRGQQEEEGKVS